MHRAQQLREEEIALSRRRHLPRQGWVRAHPCPPGACRRWGRWTTRTAIESGALGERLEKKRFDRKDTPTSTPPPFLSGVFDEVEDRQQGCAGSLPKERSWRIILLSASSSRRVSRPPCVAVARACFTLGGFCGATRRRRGFCLPLVSKPKSQRTRACSLCLSTPHECDARMYVDYVLCLQRACCSPISCISSAANMLVAQF